MLAALTLLAVLAPAALAAPGEVRVPRDVARETSPPPFARTCVVSFDELAPVDAACPIAFYSEDWDGPVLLAHNSAARTVWVSYIYQGVDGRRYHGPCYELPAGSTRAVTDQAITPLAPRQVHVTIPPGPGFPSAGFQISCKDRRQIVVDP
jgi:hypothetical protein